MNPVLYSTLFTSYYLVVTKPNVIHATFVGFLYWYEAALGEKTSWAYPGDLLQFNIASACFFQGQDQIQQVNQYTAHWKYRLDVAACECVYSPSLF